LAYDVSTTPTVGDATKVNEYTRLRDAIKALSASCNHNLGGSLSQFVSDTTYANLPDYLEWEIDGTNLSGLSVYFEVNMQCGPTLSSCTGSMQLYNVTTAAAIASSAVSVIFSSVNERGHTKSAALTLTSGINRYRAQIKTSDATKVVAGVARVSIRG
jgi:hypothetical protein